MSDENGLVYMRARYYSPTFKRFINADVVAGSITNAITLNRYAYANGNPVSNVDPFGLEAERGNNDSSWFNDLSLWWTDITSWISDNIVHPITDFFDPSINTISGQFHDGIFRGSGSLTGGYYESNVRLQINSKDDKNNGMLGVFGKVSVGNASGKVGIGNDTVALHLKGVGDSLTATVQAGIQYKNGIGLAAKAKAAVLSGRITTELDLLGWQVEIGVSGDLLSVGAEAMIGYFPEEGFTAKASAGVGLFGAGFVFRIKPPQ